MRGLAALALSLITARSSAGLVAFEHDGGVTCADAGSVSDDAHHDCPEARPTDSPDVVILCEGMDAGSKCCGRVDDAGVAYAECIECDVDAAETWVR